MPNRNPRKFGQMTTWHDRLQEALDARGLDWPDLVTATGKTKPSVYAWKPTATKRTKMMEAENASKVCSLLRINSDWLFSGRPPSGLEANVTRLPPKTHPDIAEVLAIMEATDDKGKAMALTAVKFALKDYKPIRKHRVS